MRFLISFLFILFSIVGISQTTYPVNQWFGSASTLTEFRGAAKAVHGFVNAVYADTTTANLAPGYLKFYPGSQIMAGDSMYFRNLTATAWLLMNGSGGGGGSQTLQQVLTTGATLTGNNTIQGGGFQYRMLNTNLYVTDGDNVIDFQGISGFTLSADNQDLHLSGLNGVIAGPNLSSTGNITVANGSRLHLGVNSSDLSSPVNGDLFYNSTTNKFRAYENGGWVDMIGGLANPMTTVGDIIIGGASGTPTSLAAGTIGYAFISNGPGVAPSWQEIPTDNLIVANAPLASVGPSTWFTSGDSLYMKRLKNTSTISWATDTDSSLLATIIDGSVTYAKIQNVTQARLLGRYTASTGVMQEISIGSGLSLDAGTGILTSTGGGDVTKVGTPVNNQIGIWTGDGTIEGVSAVQYNGTTFGIGGTMAASAILDLTSTSQGFLAPRMNTTQQDAISSPATGLLIYNTDSTLFRFYSGSAWTSIAAGSGGGGGGSGTVNSGTQYRIAYYATTGTAVSEAAAITANMVLVSDANGVPTHSSVTTTTLGFLDATSSIQTQLDSKQVITTTNPSHTGITPTGTGVMPVWYPARISSDFTLTNGTSAQNAFPTTIDVWTLQGNTTYYFKGVYAITSGNTSHALGMSFALGGGASLTRINYAVNSRQTSTAIGSATSTMVATNSNTAVTIAAAGGNHQVVFEGWITMNAGGTITPQITFTADPTGTILMKTDSWIMFSPIGDGSFVSTGPVN